MSKPKKNRLPYNAAIRNAHFGIRRGIPFNKHGKPTGEHPSEVYVKWDAK